VGTTQVSFGDALRSRRKQLGLNREAVAFAIGRTVVTVGNWERGRSRPNQDDLCELARALGCDPTDLVRPERANV